MTAFFEHGARQFASGPVNLCFEDLTIRFQAQPIGFTHGLPAQQIRFDFHQVAIVLESLLRRDREGLGRRPVAQPLNRSIPQNRVVVSGRRVAHRLHLVTRLEKHLLLRLDHEPLFVVANE